MRIHFFTAPFYFAFIWFRVQGSRFRALVAASPPFLEDGILVSQPSPLGEGAPQGRIGHRRHENGTAHKIRKRRGAFCMMDKLFHIMGALYEWCAPNP